MRIDFVEVSSIDVAVTVRGTMTDEECREFVERFSEVVELSFGELQWFDEDAFVMRSRDTVMLKHDDFLGMDDALREVARMILGADRVRGTSMSMGNMMVQWEMELGFYKNRTAPERSGKVIDLTIWKNRGPVQ
jgi:hypothetical protein